MFTRIFRCVLLIFQAFKAEGQFNHHVLSTTWDLSSLVCCQLVFEEMAVEHVHVDSCQDHWILETGPSLISSWTLGLSWRSGRRWPPGEAWAQSTCGKTAQASDLLAETVLLPHMVFSAGPAALQLGSIGSCSETDSCCPSCPCQRSRLSAAGACPPSNMYYPIWCPGPKQQSALPLASVFRWSYFF